MLGQSTYRPSCLWDVGWELSAWRNDRWKKQTPPHRTASEVRIEPWALPAAPLRSGTFWSQSDLVLYRTSIAQKLLIMRKWWHAQQGRHIHNGDDLTRQQHGNNVHSYLSPLVNQCIICTSSPRFHTVPENRSAEHHSDHWDTQMFTAVHRCQATN